MPIGNEIPDPVSVTTRVVQGLFYCFGALICIVAALKRFTPRSREQEQGIKIISRRQVASRLTLLAIEVEGERFLIGSTANDLKMLARLNNTNSIEQELNALLASEQLPENRQELDEVVHG